MKTKKILKSIAIAIIALTVIFFWGEEIEYALREDTKQTPLMEIIKKPKLLRNIMKGNAMSLALNYADF